MFCRSAKEYLMGGQQQLPYVAARDAVLGAVLGGLEGFLSINSKYEAYVTEINSLQTDLNILREKIKENYPLLENLNETMTDLNVV